MLPADFLTGKGGVTRLAHLRRAGFTRGQIDHAVDSGLMLKHRHGVYRLPLADPDFVRAYELNAAVSCVSAAGHYALWTIRTSDRPHLAASHRRLPAGHLAHRQQPATVS